MSALAAETAKPLILPNLAAALVAGVAAADVYVAAAKAAVATASSTCTCAAPRSPTRS